MRLLPLVFLTLVCHNTFASDFFADCEKKAQPLELSPMSPLDFIHYRRHLHESAAASPEQVPNEIREFLFERFKALLFAQEAEDILLTANLDYYHNQRLFQATVASMFKERNWYAPFLEDHRKEIIDIICRASFFMETLLKNEVEKEMGFRLDTADFPESGEKGRMLRLTWRLESHYYFFPDNPPAFSPKIKSMHAAEEIPRWVFLQNVDTKSHGDTVRISSRLYKIKRGEHVTFLVDEGDITHLARDPENTPLDRGHVFSVLRTDELWITNPERFLP